MRTKVIKSGWEKYRTELNFPDWIICRRLIFTSPTGLHFIRIGTIVKKVPLQLCTNVSLFPSKVALVFI